MAETPPSFRQRAALGRRLADELRSDGYSIRLIADPEIERVRIYIQGHGQLRITTHGRLNAEYCEPQRGVFQTAASLLGIPLVPDMPTKPVRQRRKSKK